MDMRRDYGGWVDLGKTGGGAEYEQNTLHKFL